MDLIEIQVRYHYIIPHTIFHSMKLQNNPFDDVAEAYDQWFDDFETTFLSELAAVRYFGPFAGRGVEIGIGTGRFAEQLGIREGVEPSEAMAALAEKRGIRVRRGIAEQLEYGNNSFDFAIMVAVDPFVEDIGKVYGEIFRILKSGGKLVVGTLHRDGEVARKYMTMTENPVYRKAVFHSVSETLSSLEKAGFTGLRTAQSLFEPHPAKTETPQPGHDRGSFVTVEAIKPA